MRVVVGKRGLCEVLIERVLRGEGRASPRQRRAAFVNEGLTGMLGALVEKVVWRPSEVTDEDVQAVLAGGLSEDQVFELVVCAAVGQASRQYEAGVAALEAAVALEGGDEDASAHSR